MKSMRANFRAVWCRDCGACVNGNVPGRLFEHQKSCEKYQKREKEWLSFIMTDFYWYTKIEPTDKQVVDYLDKCLDYNLKYR